MGRDGRGVKAASDSTIEITFTYKNVRCRERIKLQPTAANLIKAERHRAAILDAIDKGTFDYAVTFPNSKNRIKFDDSGFTVERYMNDWLINKQPTLKVSTFTDYEKSVHKINKALGHHLLSELKRVHVYEWVKSLTCSNKRIANLISPLRCALDEAVQHGILENNVISGWRYKRNEPPKKTDIDPFTADEQQRILNATSGPVRNLIQFAFWTGLRTSELVALQWTDIDFEKGVIHVQRAKTQYAKQAETTKTKAGTRQVKILPPALEALNAQKAHTFLKCAQVFINPITDKPFVGDQAIRKSLWQPALKKAGVTYRRPYQTRHTYASMMLSAGEPLAWVSKQLGHSNVLMTAQVYATYIQDSQPDAGQRAVDLFGAG
jgi:integrase